MKSVMSCRNECSRGLVVEPETVRRLVFFRNAVNTNCRHKMLCQ